MSQIQWAMWANEQAVVSGLVLLTGSIVGISGKFSKWGFGIYGIIISVLILMVEWPRGKRIKGNTIERRFQRIFTILVNKLGIFGRNYFIRFVGYLLLAIPSCFILATVLGAVSLLLSGLIYFLAAIKGEEWIPSNLEGEIEKKRRSIHPPKKPPPRPANPQGTSDVATITVEIPETHTPQVRTEKRPPTRPPPRPRGASKDGEQNTV